MNFARESKNCGNILGTGSGSVATDECSEDTAKDTVKVTVEDTAEDTEEDTVKDTAEDTVEDTGAEAEVTQTLSVMEQIKINEEKSKLVGRYHDVD